MYLCLGWFGVYFSPSFFFLFRFWLRLYQGLQVEPGALVQNQLLFLYITLIPGRGADKLIKSISQASRALDHRFLAFI